jgi:hypothetical protein
MASAPAAGSVGGERAEFASFMPPREAPPPGQARWRPDLPRGRARGVRLLHASSQGPTSKASAPVAGSASGASAPAAAAAASRGCPASYSPLPSLYGPWASLARWMGRASRAGPAQKMAQ